MWKVIVLVDGCPMKDLRSFPSEADALKALRQSWDTYRRAGMELGLVGPDGRLRSFVV